MEKLTLKEAKTIALTEIGFDSFDINRPVILDKFTLDFEWGCVFRYDGKRAIETGDFEQYGCLGNCQILVDKLKGSVVNGIISPSKILDSTLEAYRIAKGYPHCIKFPIKESLVDKSPIEKVKLLFETKEIFQIQQGIKIVQKYNLFDLDLFKKIIFNNAFPKWTFEEQIAEMSDQIILNSGIGREFPSDFMILNDAKRLSLSGVFFSRITDSIQKLKHLEQLSIWNSNIEEISSEILKLSALKYIDILDSKLGKQAKYMLNQMKETKGVQIDFFE